MSTPKTVLTESQQERILAGLKHLDTQTIQDYVQEKLTDPAERARVESHLFGCDECLTEYNRAFDSHSPYKADFDAFQEKLAQSALEPEREWTPTVQGVEKRRLVAALERLSSASGQWKERLLQWRDLLLATEERYSASLTAFLQPDSKDSYLSVLDSLSSPNRDVAYMSATRGTRRGVRRTPQGSDMGSGMVVMVGEWLDVTVLIEEDSILLEFTKWSDTTDPLVVLLPEQGDLEPLLPEADKIVSDAAGNVEVRFENVPLGAYLLSIAPSGTQLP